MKSARSDLLSKHQNFNFLINWASPLTFYFLYVQTSICNVSTYTELHNFFRWKKYRSYSADIIVNHSGFYSGFFSSPFSSPAIHTGSQTSDFESQSQLKRKVQLSFDRQKVSRSPIHTLKKHIAAQSIHVSSVVVLLFTVPPF